DDPHPAVVRIDQYPVAGGIDRQARPLPELSFGDRAAIAAEPVPLLGERVDVPGAQLAAVERPRPLCEHSESLPDSHAGHDLRRKPSPLPTLGGQPPSAPRRQGRPPPAPRPPPPSPGIAYPFRSQVDHEPATPRSRPTSRPERLQPADPSHLALPRRAVGQLGLPERQPGPFRVR